MKRYLATSLLLLSTGAQALEVQCVSTATELQTALTNATQSADLNQEIRLVAGIYNFKLAPQTPADAVVFNRTADLVNLTFEGGYNADCSDKPALGSLYTVFDLVASVRIQAGGSIVLRDLTFLTDGGSYFVQSNSSSVLVERVGMSGNVADGRDVFSVLASNDVTLTNILVYSLVRTNCGIVAASFNEGNVAINHVTVLVGKAGPIQNESGICLDGLNSAKSISLTNSISETLVSNQDVLVNTSAPTLVRNNVYGTGALITPSATTTLTNNIVVDANVIFANVAIGDVSPSMVLEGSTAVDTGFTVNPASPVTVDVYGNPRLYGRPDRGAIETDRIFGSGFK